MIMNAILLVNLCSPQDLHLRSINEYLMSVSSTPLPLQPTPYVSLSVGAASTRCIRVTSRRWRAHSGSAGLEAKTSTRRREPPQRSSIFMSSALRIGGCGLYLSSILVTSCFDQCLFCWLDDTAARMLRNRWQSCGLYMVNV